MNLLKATHWGFAASKYVLQHLQFDKVQEKISSGMLLMPICRGTRKISLYRISDVIIRGEGVT